LLVSGHSCLSNLYNSCTTTHRSPRAHFVLDFRYNSCTIIKPDEKHPRQEPVTRAPYRQSGRSKAEGNSPKYSRRNREG
jgi:hypothetical protein